MPKTLSDETITEIHKDIKSLFVTVGADNQTEAFLLMAIALHSLRAAGFKNVPKSAADIVDAFSIHKGVNSHG